MRVAVFIKRTTFHDGFGGMETQNKVLCEGLMKKGFEVVVFSPSRELEKTEEKENGVRYIFVKSVYRTLFSRSNKNNWFSKSVEAFAAEHTKNPFDIVISQSVSGVGVILRKTEFGVKVISVSHGSIISEIKTRLSNISDLKSVVQLLPDLLFSLYIFFGRQRDFIHGSDLVVCVSSHIKKALKDETFASDEKFTVINNGISVEGFAGAELSSTEQQVSLLYVGRLEKEKGTDLFLDIAKDARFDGLTLDVFGTGPQEDFLRENLQNKSTPLRVNIHGRVPYDEVLKEYRPGRVFILPSSRVEGFPMVLAEAMYGGCVVVSYNVGGVSDAVIDNSTGILVEPGNSSQFINKVYNIIEDTNLRNTLSKNAKEKAQNDLTSEKMVENYVKCINKLVK
ncbi:glycosyltransferase family 4 protein [Patescibacteria group bacterium]|nr:glycosyltransferase family 4 protein [Patescibacteria group bacterium]